MSHRLRLVIARAIRAERVRAGMSQRDLAAALDWSQATVAQVEGAHRRVAADELADLCRALKVDLDRLLIAAPEEDRRALGLS